MWKYRFRLRFQDFRKLGLLINMQFAFSYETLKTIENWTAFGQKIGERKLTSSHDQRENQLVRRKSCP